MPFFKPFKTALIALFFPHVIAKLSIASKTAARASAVSRCQLLASDKSASFGRSIIAFDLCSGIPVKDRRANSSFALKVDDVIDSGAGLSPSGAGNLTYASSDEGVVKVVDGKLVAVGVGSAVVNVSFAGDYKYLPAQNKTISV